MKDGEKGKEGQRDAREHIAAEVCRVSANTIEIGPLLAVLRKTSTGAQITDHELQAASWQADGKLEDLCSQAWTRLRWWSGDDDIRAKDAEYAKTTQEYLEWLLEEITKEANLRGVATD